MQPDSEEWGKMQEKQPWQYQAQWRRVSRCSRCQSRHSPEAYGEDHGDAGCHPAAHERSLNIHSIACGSSCARVDGWALKEDADHRVPMQEQAFGRSWGPQARTHTEVGFLEEPVVCRGTTLEQSVLEGLYPMARSHAGAVSETLQPVGRTHVGEVNEELRPMVRTPFWSNITAWKGRGSRDKLLWTGCNLDSLFSCTAQEKEVEESGMKE